MTLGDRLLTILPTTRDQAVTIPDLARWAHASTRQVEAALQELAGSGQHPIVATSGEPKGVWLGNRADVREYLDRHDARIRTMLRRRRGLRRWLDATAGYEQPEIWQVAS